ncbi:microcephalin-like [Plakobranchus ocellatus]|uniref:Microcephalin-like n=1 Tax=Plakobranchus ocellatus TaxID=259542 RepID=A0AAV4CXJ3_9GAST|nr:microcephalin-like [Plakobranchus ocellatus]
MLVGKGLREQELVYSVLKKFGVLHLTNSVEASSTHVVCGEPRRPLNLLRAIAQECWVLSKEWVFKSLEAGSSLREEEFDMDIMNYQLSRRPSYQRKVGMAERTLSEAPYVSEHDSDEHICTELSRSLLATIANQAIPTA